ncbi:MAG: SsrA-binding protein SmpB [bacterium]|nr:SsrA-binding protein SmpB [Candidatus Sumerlaeota bacterium]
MSKDTTIKVIATNRKAFHFYHISERIEAGLVLQGTEVKSLRAGKASLVDSYASFERGEAFIQNMNISHYDKGNRFNHPERRPRKLLLHKKEISRLVGQVSQKGFTLIPLQLYFKGSCVKVEMGLARGKKEFDRRHDIKERESKREIDRTLKEHRHTA